MYKICSLVTKVLEFVVKKRRDWLWRKDLSESDEFNKISWVLDGLAQAKMYFDILSRS